MSIVTIGFGALPNVHNAGGWHSDCKTGVTMLNTPLPSTTSSISDAGLYQTDTPDVRVCLLTSISDMLRWAELWIDLDRRTSASMVYFQSYEWCRTWMLAQNENSIPQILMVIEHGALVAVWPLMRQKLGGGLFALRALGEPHTQYANILTENGTLSSACISAIQHSLKHIQNVDTLILTYVPQTSLLVKVLPKKSTVASMANEACYLELLLFKDAADYWVKAGKRKRYNRKKAIAILSDLGEVRLEVYRPGMANYEAMIAENLAMKNVWLRQTGRFSIGLTASYHQDFINALPGANDDGAILFALMAGNRPIAFEFGFLQNGHFNCYMTSYGWGYRYASPGTLLIGMVIEWLIDRGAKTFDLLGNPEDYKRSWTNVALPLSGHIYNFTWAGALYGNVWSRSLRPTLKALYRRVPQALRTSINIVRKLNIPVVL